MFYFITFSIAVVSIALALKSLWSLSEMREVHKVKKNLQKGKVIFHKDASAGASSS